MSKHLMPSAVLVLGLALGTPLAWSQEASGGDIAELSLEQLENIVITSVSRQEERLSNAAASIFIISASDIRRSGVRSLPEALRLAPNLQVARIDARNYAITARGFNSAFTNKLLVLIDGRSIYSPLFSGVFWDAQDVVLEDIERIEVISGPGATIWGVNAVNGVINIITRSAKDTQDGMVSVSAGRDDRDGTVRYGGRLPKGGHYRAYAKTVEVDDTANAAGASRFTGFRRRQAGFRADWDLTQGGLSISGDAYQGALEQARTRDIRIAGANLVGRWTRKLSDESNLRLQMVLDHTERSQPNAFVEKLDTVELEAQHDLRLGNTHAIAWGGGIRFSRDDLTNAAAFSFLPADKELHWANIFVQDEIALRDNLRLTLGMKVEHNNYTGAETLPGVRLGWSFAPGHLLWGNLARTVRAPSRIDRDIYVPSKPIMIGGVPRYQIAGGPTFESEVANVAELGYRVQPSSRWTFSATAYYAKYDRLRTLEPNTANLPYTGLQEFRNMGDGHVRGLELWARWQLAERWRLNAGAVVQSVDTGLEPGSRDVSARTGLATNDPNRHWLLRSSHDLSARSQLDWTLRYTGALANPQVPAYYELDLQWTWKPMPNLDVALIGQNLLHSSHAEFGTSPGRSVFERSGLLKLTWRF
ncbi:TonB-dependent receptor plug domain-containing protein [Massilia endophytica]|uniref:TonB-dependent receptor plug domain-containing protein n=1 Tax=Massilia endophytica TaxID=2899220 RepID=UPI001E5276F8|nr:TonB-dependent receptor [Massilia endophytica]UGQ47995.1 TonB-dependent receptor [Massilia endophytica]